MATSDDGRKRTWRFKLNDATTLEVSAKKPVTEKQVRRRGRWSLILGTLIAAAALAGVAYADTIAPDADLVAVGNQASRNLGSVAPGAMLTPQVSFELQCGGNQHVDENGSVNLTFSSGQSTIPPGGSMSATGTSIGPIPAIWPNDNNQCTSPSPTPILDNGNSTVTITAPTVAGTYTFVPKWIVTAPETSDVTGTGPSVSFTLTVQAANQPPTADAGGPYSGNEGSSISLDGTGSSDSDGSVASYSWTVTPQSGGANDPDSGASCSFVDGTSSTDSQPKVACTDDGIYDVALSVTDDDGASDGDSTTLTLANANPTATANIPGGNVNEGDSFNLSLSSPTDPGSNDTFTYQFDCGDGGGYNAASTTASRSCPTTDNGSRSVKLKILDDDGGFTEYTGTVTVVNVAPTVTLNGPVSANEGETKSYSFSWTDPGADTWTRTVSCGTNGTVSISTFDQSTKTGGFDCTWPDNFTGELVSVTVQDDDAGSGNASKSVNIANVAPTVVAEFTSVSVNCQTTATLTIDPNDAGVNDSPWKVNIDWGDGSTEPEISRTNLSSFTVTHVYALAGAYNATVSVTDKDNATGSDLVNGITINQTYTVDFLPPFDDSTPSGLIVNKMKSGRVVPVKVTLSDDCAQAYVTDPAANVTIKVTKTSGTGTGDAIEEYADAGESSAGTNEFRWTSDFWIYNLDSKALGLVVNNLYRVDVYVDGVKATVSNWAVLSPVK